MGVSRVNGVINLWEYYQVPKEDIPEIIRLWQDIFLKDPKLLTRAMSQVLYKPEDLGRGHKELQGAAAAKAALWFIQADFIGMKYERYHPTFKMKDTPQEILKYLRPPYNGMKNLGYEEQKRYKATLPKEIKEMIYIDE